MLSNILTEIASETGISLTNASEKALLLTRVIRAAKELYATKGLFGSLFEDVFDINQSSNQISLPWYVKTVLGMRYFDGRFAIQLEDIQSRYYYGLDTEVWSLKFRSKDRSPLSREISNQSVLKFKPVRKESSDVTISICGPTNFSSNYSETIVIPKNTEDAVSTIGNYKDPIRSIIKTKPSQYDITILDVEDNEMGVIPNNLLQSDYNVIQYMDGETPPPSGTDAIEVLYEKPFFPFINDTDQFVFGDEYDDAIIWKYYEHRSKTPELALTYQTKCQQVLDAIWKKALEGVKQKLNFKRGPYFNPPYKDTGYMYRSYEL